MNEYDVITYLKFLSNTAFEILYVLEENELTAQEIQQALFERNAVNDFREIKRGGVVVEMWSESVTDAINELKMGLVVCVDKKFSLTENGKQMAKYR